MNLNTKQVAIILSLVLIGSAVLFKTAQYYQQEPKPVEGSTAAQVVSEPLNFQGDKNGVRLDNGVLTLDTYTELEKENISTGYRVTGSDQSLFITGRNGQTYRWNGDSMEKIDIDSSYGAVAGDFDYPGYNIIYADSERNVYIRNLDSGEEERLYSGAMEVLKTDTDSNGVYDAAEIRLINGSTFLKQIRSENTQRDWDNDDYEEQMYISGSSLVSYDRKHGQERLVNATSLNIVEDRIYVSSNGKIRKLEFEQKYVEQGSYTAVEEKFNGSVEIVQIIAETQLNGGEISGKLVTDEGNSSFELGNGMTEATFDLEGSEAKVRFNLETENPDRTPEIHSYSLRIRTDRQ